MPVLLAAGESQLPAPCRCSFAFACRLFAAQVPLSSSRSPHWQLLLPLFYPRPPQGIRMLGKAESLSVLGTHPLRTPAPTLLYPHTTSNHHP